MLSLLHALLSQMPAPAATTSFPTQLLLAGLSGALSVSAGLLAVLWQGEVKRRELAEREIKSQGEAISDLRLRMAATDAASTKLDRDLTSFGDNNKEVNQKLDTIVAAVSDVKSTVALLAHRVQIMEGHAPRSPRRK